MALFGLASSSLSDEEEADAFDDTMLFDTLTVVVSPPPCLVSTTVTAGVVVRDGLATIAKVPFTQHATRGACSIAVRCC